MGIVSSTTNALKIKGKLVDDSQIGDGKALVYNSTTGKIEYDSVSVDLSAYYTAAQTDTLLSDKASNADLNDHSNEVDTHGVDEIVGTTEVQTLTNKTISGALNTLTAIPQSAVTDLVSDLAGKASTGSLASYLPLTGGTLSGELAGTTITATKYFGGSSSAATVYQHLNFGGF